MVLRGKVWVLGYSGLVKSMDTSNGGTENSAPQVLMWSELVCIINRKIQSCCSYASVFEYAGTCYF